MNSLSGSRRAALGYCAVFALTLLALGLRLYGVGDLRLYSDSAYSVAVARQSLADLTASRAYDGHPPLFYYILFGWLRLVETTELTARLPAILLGVALVPAVFALGRSLVGVRGGLIAAALVAVAPDLVVHSRLVRMYSLLPLAVTASWLLLIRARRIGGRAWALHFAATLVALFSHYYALLGLAGQGIWLLTRASARERRAGFASLGLAGLIFAPWLIYAVPSQAPTTARIIDSTPPPAGIVGYVQEVWLPFWAFYQTDAIIAWTLGAAGVLLLAAAALAAWRRTGSESLRRAGLPYLMVATPLALSVCVFLTVPLAVRTRFFVVVLPFLFVLLGALLSAARPRVAVAIGSAALAVQALSLGPAYAVERAAYERDAEQIADHLGQHGQADDLVVMQAGWEIGYLLAHPVGPPVRYRELSDVESEPLEPLLSHRRIWLATYNQIPSERSAGRFLDSCSAAVEQVQFGPSRLTLYLVPPRPAIQPSARFDAGIERGPVALVGSALTGEAVAAGEPLAVGLDWLVDSAADPKLVVMLHLLSESGERAAGQDVPLASGCPTAGSGGGRHFTSAHGFRLAADQPPGAYTLVAGLYPAGGGPRLKLLGGDGDVIPIGRVQVTPKR